LGDVVGVFGQNDASDTGHERVRGAEAEFSILSPE